MKVAVLQLSSQGMSSTKFYNYVRIAHKQDVKLILLGEYILNPFFKELQTLSIGMLQEQVEHHIKVLKELSLTYNITIVAPLVIVKKDKLYKCVARFSSAKSYFYEQQILIDYAHWNEEKFFANEAKEIDTIATFKVGGVKFGIISGFETHFDTFWQLSSGVDCVLVPSVSTFDSYERWKNLLLTRAFTHNCYVLRANRIGEYIHKDISWHFYGDSFLASPNGELLEHLGNKEELLIADISHSEVLNSKRIWHFNSIATRRGLGC